MSLDADLCGVVERLSTEVAVLREAMQGEGPVITLAEGQYVARWPHAGRPRLVPVASELIDQWVADLNRARQADELAERLSHLLVACEEVLSPICHDDKEHEIIGCAGLDSYWDDESVCIAEAMVAARAFLNSLHHEASQ